jgi:glycosyltransferase involved in cell wall biosynthesis
MNFNNSPVEPTIALLHWGDLIEDFLDTIGVSFEAFCHEMTGGWMFGYIEALRRVGVRTVLFCISNSVTEPVYYTHKHTGAKICALPTPQLYQSVRRQMLNPQGWTVRDMFGEVRGLRRLMLTGVKTVTPYLATPLGLLAKELRRENCQAILCQEYEYPRFDACNWLGWRMGLPVFATFQGGDFQVSPWEKLSRPLSLKTSAGLIIASQTEVQRVQTRYGVPSTKIARIFNPLDLELWQPMDRAEARQLLGFPNEAEIVICHGRIEIRRKGLDILLEAWQQVCSVRPGRDLRLLLVGTGTQHNELGQMIAQMQLPGIVWVNEYVRDRALMRQYLSAADVYTLSSRHEGFPVAPLEAMACGLPVVAADAPGVPDILAGGEADGGIVVPRENAALLAGGIGRILDDRAWGRELGKRARIRVENHFSLEVIGGQLRQFLCDRSLPG